MKSQPHFLLYLLTLALCACSEEPATTQPDNPQNPTNPAFGYIGFGYDLTENWANQEGKRGIVFDVSKLPSTYLQTTSLEQLSYSQITATSIDEYESKMSAGVGVSGNYKFFSGAVRVNFAQEQYRYRGRSFSTIQYYIQKSRTDIISNYATIQHLRQYMNDVARADLDGAASPETIFARYGTHVMTGAVMGARLDYNVSIETSKIASGSSLDVMARAGCKAKFAGAEISGEFSSTQERESYDQYSTVRIHAYGGKPELVEEQNNFSEWRHSIDTSRVWMRFTEAGLIPIWEFCSDSTRKNLIRDALPAWIQRSAITTEDPPLQPSMCIIDIITSASFGADTVPHDGLTYYRLEADLNAGVNGARNVYLYYALGYDTIRTGERTPITSMRLGQATSTPSVARDRAQEGGHVLVEGVDLNYDAGGDFIYLGIKREQGADPIRGLMVYNQSVQQRKFSRGASSTGLTEVPSNLAGLLDLNRNAGGHYIYLYYTKDK